MGMFAVDFDSNDHLTTNSLSLPFQRKLKEIKSTKENIEVAFQLPQGIQ
jgi:hypothetical protein